MRCTIQAGITRPSSNACAKRARRGHDLPFATDLSAAVARLVQLVPPTRLDLVDEVIVRVARRDLSVTLDWPPTHVAHQLVFRSGASTPVKCRSGGRRARWST